ncbi:uncharacterized protein BO95DRAFT_494325 [Aspergillus brunneoviolaceus CBS 621.78]|uniref:Uncharacterized protein n=1 Tax=Aspergillus brunneoviolaceus CBS 621.78 TaxID=1450534 RepID=A0ACD1GBH8_9EURO|nr:hypothetical protein BO95DRAFT_494325 [Aspergillus brunneoviolaceus CBS 621.78]RAH46631.1 hypothetical protein BO95DRAFT_494325 [Aspergillus brunneoviolaceus CBS 621.78]
METPEDHGYLLLATYLFHCEDHYAILYIQAQIYFPPRFSDIWEEADLLDLLPSSVCNHHIHQQLRAIHEQLQEGEVVLASCRRSFTLNNNLCTRCDSTYPAGKMF